MPMSLLDDHQMASLADRILKIRGGRIVKEKGII
jgi:hypothetical protein